MSKVSIQEISKILIGKYGLGSLESESFANAMFNVIKAGLESDGIVKVKGLGTFKIIGVEARESVNVNTGERVIIDSHGKITFTPDTTMKELVNKPFSQFETVVLGDGIEIMDTNTDADGEETAEQTDNQADGTQETKESQAAVSSDVNVDKTDLAARQEDESIVDTEEKQFVSEPAENEISSSLPDKEAEPIPEEETEIQEEDDSSDDDSNKSQVYKWVIYFLIVCVMCFISAYGGYRYGLYTANKQVVSTINNVKKGRPANSNKKSVSKVDLPDTTKIIEKKDTLQKQTATHDSVIVAPDYDKYDEMDARVRTGAYRIVGTDYVRTVKAGETLAGISRATLGEGMICYIEVYNDLRQNASIQEGQKIKIPKLELKKKRKKNNK